MNDRDEFQYTYSAKEQAELKRIQEKYLPDSKNPRIDKMTRLRRLDARVTQKGTAVSLCVGIFSVLLMGFGMSLIMTDISIFLGCSSFAALLLGLAFGCFGMVGVLSAYPLYQFLVARERKRIAPEILRLTEELMNQHS